MKLTPRTLVYAHLVLMAVVLLVGTFGCATADDATKKEAEAQHQQSKPEGNEGEGAIFITPNEGTVIVQTIYGEIKQVIRPQGGGITVAPWVFGDDYHTVNLRPATDDYTVRSSAQNAPFKLTVRVNAKTRDDDENIKRYLREFGLDAQSRHTQRRSRIEGALNTKLKEVVQRFDAYALLSNVPTIQSELQAALKPVVESAFMELITVEIMGLPDFDNDSIDNAASLVVAAQKEKEAAEARLEAAKVTAKQREVEATSYANPQYREIKLMELRIQEAEAWARHSGTLVFGQVPGGVRLNVQ